MPETSNDVCPLSNREQVKDIRVSYGDTGTGPWDCQDEREEFLSGSLPQELLGRPGRPVSRRLPLRDRGLMVVVSSDTT